jgi:hypothetical protein
MQDTVLSIARGKIISYGMDDVVDFVVSEFGEHGQGNVLTCVTFRLWQRIAR